MSTLHDLERPSVDSADNVCLFDLSIANESMKKAVDWVFQPRESFEYAAFVNAHSVNVCYRDNNEMRKSLQAASKLFADGSGIGLAARLHGTRFIENVNGTDMLPEICHRAQLEGKSVFLLGAAEGVAEKTRDSLIAEYPELRIVGTQHGFFDHKGLENELVVEKINQSGADILLVGFGSPFQEEWLQANAERLKVDVGLAVGGLFDFYSGLIPRAPLWMRHVGIEWVWRLAQEPKAKFSRYIIGNPVFLARALHDRIYSESGAAITSGYYSSPGLSSYLQRLAAMLVLTILAPFLLLIGLIVKLSSDGPVFYHQVRVGKYGKRFKFYKFRSMYLPGDPKFKAPDESQSDRDGVCKKYKQDPRITPIGRFIRKYSIDELPQLWNVVIGDMVLVGPRPALIEEVEAYQHNMYRRFDVLPGLTGLWQVSGRADTSFDEQIELDLRYVNKRGWMSDVGILLRTIPAVLLARGAY